MSVFQKGLIYLSSASLIFMVSGYLISIWLGRYLGPADYGIYGIVISLMTAVNIIQTSGLPQATSKFVAEDRGDSDDILKSSLIIQIISTLAITFLYFLLAKPIAAALNDLSLIPYIQLSSLILPLYSLFTLYTGYYNGRHNFRRQALMNIVYSIAKVAAVIAFVYFWHLYGAIVGFILSPAVALLFGFYWPRSQNVFPYKKLINFSLPLIGFAIVSTLQISIDLFFVKSILQSDHAAGLYTATQNIARIPFYGLSAFALVLFPSISKSVSQDLREETRHTIEKALRNVLWILIPGIIFMAALSKPILRLLFTAEYTEASQALSILLVGLAFLTLFTLLSNALNGAGRSRLSLIFSIVGLIITIIFCKLLIPTQGLSGAALATTIGGAVSFILALTATRRLFGVKII